ncbi:nuclease-related domain-containing protein [Vibrio sp. Vb0301]|uniref:nuclease-related domain-containing protein n=1 Tax=Vibrio sp. Vb0301 TaxID=3074622 RepID=UPI00296423C5|nr:nuclease-related domain-containing protein [Vibrio sp. Vb0301]MDW2010954.1 nuclease-related domain-containing protein [Vibrio sp. Vb0301]
MMRLQTKHYKGWIYGKESDQFWTQKIFKRSYKFQNPFRQNYKHVKAIQSLLPSIPQEAFYSIVVMVGECEWRSKNTPKLLFTSGWKAADYIYEQSKESSFIDINSVYESLESARLEKGLKTNFKHVKNLKAKHRA